MINIDTIKSLETLATPFYFYDMDLLKKTLDNVVNLATKYNIHVHYAIKANVDDYILRNISERGLGADCVSGNEVLQAVKCGFTPSKIVFAGVGKTDKEIFDALKLGISSFNCESLQEIQIINTFAAKLGLVANISLRVNPNIDAHTHKAITTGLNENKFGVAEHEFEEAITLINNCENIVFKGLHIHVGSQITKVEEVFTNQTLRAAEIVEWFEERGLRIENINLGGGLGINYQSPNEELIADYESWFKAITSSIKLKEYQKILIEPGRSIVAQCGTMVSRVLFVKNGVNKDFLILDAGMNDLIRPAFYGSYHSIENLSATLRGEEKTQAYDVVGPVCESSDVWAEGRELALSHRGDLMAFRSAGAYGQVMASRYNLKELAPAVYSDRLDEAELKIDYLNLR